MNFPDLPHLKQLQNLLWQWPKSRAAVMVGAGLSLNAEPLPGVTTHFPTWRQLVRAMFDELYPLYPNTSDDELRSREARFLSTNALRLASEYEATFGEGKLEQLIRIQNPDSDYQPGLLHKLLLQLPWADVFTTNYDTLLERTEIPNRTYQPVIKAIELTTAFSPRIVKLHGSFPSQTPFIVTEEHYRKYPSEFAPFINSVQQSLLENTFVLIGFSGDDPNFLAWTGWIRDELGDHHSPIYLVGVLCMNPTKRALLEKRGVTAIDLSPIYENVSFSKNIHAASLEWFLRNLDVARPPRPEAWPDLDRGFETEPQFNPPLILGGEKTPEVVQTIPDPQKPITIETVINVFKRWKYERKHYPGWLVADQSKRSELWFRTRYWIMPLLEKTEDFPATDRILLFREVNWRLETSMVPLFQNWIKHFEKAVDELFSKLIDDNAVLSSYSFPATEKNEFLDAWLELAFALLREAREMYDADRWKILKNQIDKTVVKCPHFEDRNQYENALWLIWNVDHQAAKTNISKWHPSPRSPLAIMWKAGLLTEMDEAGEARTALRIALAEIRKGLRNNGRHIGLLSMEGWCLFNLETNEMTLDVAQYFRKRYEFLERYHELKAWDCSPWPHIEYFKEALSGPPPMVNRNAQNIPGFDPGSSSISYNIGGDNIDPVLPAFGCIRLFEYIGMPMHVANVNIIGEALKNACLWIIPHINFWSPALLIRAGTADTFKNGNILSRTAVAEMDCDLAKRLFEWCFGILKNEINADRGLIDPGSTHEALLKILPEVLSRLALKLGNEELTKAFELALQIHTLPTVRTNYGLHNTCKSWFRRLFETADSALLLTWLPKLIRAPILENPVIRLLPANYFWPDPMKEFPINRDFNNNAALDGLEEQIKKSIDWLLRKADIEDGEPRQRAITRLRYLYYVNLMSQEHKQRFGALIWDQTATTGLPHIPFCAAFGYLHLPSPAHIDVQLVLKQYFLETNPEHYVVRGKSGEMASIKDPVGILWAADVSWASKPIVQLKDEAQGRLKWTEEESKILYKKVQSWWINDKEAIGKEPIGRKPILNALKTVGEFLSRAVIPCIPASDPIWADMVGWLQEMRNLGVFPTVALPYVLVKHPEHEKEYASLILSDLNNDVPDAVEAAANAIRHWLNLVAVSQAPEPQEVLLSSLISRVIFRRKPGIKRCIEYLADLIREQPQKISKAQIQLLDASLVPWHKATILPVSGDWMGDYDENERPEFRALLGNLACAMNGWMKKAEPNHSELPGVSLWRQSCASDSLPEVRRAFSELEIVKEPE